MIRIFWKQLFNIDMVNNFRWQLIINNTVDRKSKFDVMCFKKFSMGSKNLVSNV